jgi:hypothetical protein
MTDQTIVLTHPTLPISATRGVWALCRCYGVCQGADGSEYLMASTHDADTMSATLLTALSRGLRDADAIGWAIAERERHREESARSNAIREEADGLRKLASAISATAEADVLERILGRLTERTRYAVRAQLRG